MGYHIRKIEKGVIGQVSKVREELEEYEDAMEQGSKIMAAVELSDAYGALEALAATQGLSMADLALMSNITVRAFRDGSRA
jgi:hypothetical protein